MEKEERRSCPLRKFPMGEKPFPQQPLEWYVSLTLLAEGRGQQH